MEKPQVFDRGERLPEQNFVVCTIVKDRDCEADRGVLSIAWVVQRRYNH